MREGDASGVALVGGAEVGDDGGAEGGVGEGVEEEVVEERGEESGGAELVPEMERQRPLQRRVRNNRRVEVARQRRLRLGVAFGLRLYLHPNPRIIFALLRRRRLQRRLLQQIPDLARRHFRLRLKPSDSERRIKDA